MKHFFCFYVFIFIFIHVSYQGLSQTIKRIDPEATLTSTNYTGSFDCLFDGSISQPGCSLIHSSNIRLKMTFPSSYYISHIIFRFVDFEVSVIADNYASDGWETGGGPGDFTVRMDIRYDAKTLELIMQDNSDQLNVKEIEVYGYGQPDLAAGKLRSRKYLGSEISYATSEKLRFRTNNKDGMMISSAKGSVNIGTASDNGGGILNVAGKMYTEQLEVQPDNLWPDYVFEPDYNLLSLSDLKNFIAQNKHLPDIPSENEIAAAAGYFEVGKLNTMLLKKVEELTLYVLDLENERKNQATKLEALQKTKRVQKMEE